MSNIAYYQEGYTDGYLDGKEITKKNIIKHLYDFIREQEEEDPQTPTLQGYNVALHELKEVLEDILKEV